MLSIRLRAENSLLTFSSVWLLAGCTRELTNAFHCGSAVPLIACTLSHVSHNPEHWCRPEKMPLLLLL